MTERQKYGIFKYTMRKDLPRIYLDMDGVLCDFGAQIRKATGKSKEQWMRIGGRVKWDTVIDYPKFWENMPWNKPGKILYNFVRKYDPHILSAYLEKAMKTEADQHGDEINQKKLDKVKADKKIADSGSKATKVETEPKVDYKN